MYNSIGEILGVAQSSFSIFVIVSIPVIIIILLISAWKFQKQFKSKIIKQLFGVLYEDFGNKKVQGL
jgi:hypothetical protein